MTREEAIKEIQDASDYEVRHGDIEHHYEDIMRRVEAFEKAVNALQKEPCVDAVSREAVLAKKDLIELPDGQSFYCIAPDDVEKLPSVTPTRKHGEWEEEVFDLGANLPVRVAYQCSECGNYFDSEFNYCPHCGADMRGGNE